MCHIYFIMGNSGSGKSTLIKNIRKLNLKNIHFPLSYKTRSLRENELSGVDYYKISKEEFFAGVQKLEFLEFALVHQDEYYGTKFEDVIDLGLKKGKNVIKELDINGLEKLRRNKPEMDNDYTTIFLEIPEKLLIERIKKRGVFISNIELEKRINSSKLERQKSRELCNYIIDATLSPEIVLEKFLEIYKNN